MAISNTSICPNCGVSMKHYDSVYRVVRTKGGTVRRIKIRRMKCPDCKRIRRDTPDYIYPYKQYEAEVINGVIEGFITPETLGYEDYPCEATMARWKSAKIANTLMRK